MKFIPRHNQIIGRMVVQKVLQKIIRPDETKDSTKFILVDAVGPGALAAGVKPGDLVIPNALGNIVLDGGASFRPIIEEKNAVCFVTEVEWDKLLVQTDNGTKYVSIESEEVAVSLGVQPSESEPKTEAA